MTLDEVTSDILSRAIGIYLRIAYGDGGYSDAVRDRAALPEGRSGDRLLADPRFERVPTDAEVARADRFNLRLGNAGYPHMKLGVDRAGESEQFVLVVDTHDRHVAAMVQEGEREAYQALLDANRRISQEIERAWTEAGLPTFERYLRGRLAASRGGAAPEGGERP